MRRVILFLSLVLSFASLALAGEKTEGNKMQTVKVDEIKEFNVDKFIKKVPLATDKIVFNTFYFKPRQILPFHKHPMTDELFYIVEGVGEFTVGNERTIVGPASAVYGPANVFHGLVNSGDKEMVVISVQAPKPVETIYAENATVTCPVCKQEFILKEGVKEGDTYICPRCGAKLIVSKTADGKWIAKQQ
ncbi:MAG TPA: cupin domain-containing protein [Candidatus Margulisiibacteriota bacterium]|nr:cupin domain-containing protein [Candidatus Margulisiibacteriota bacterium]